MRRYAVLFALVASVLWLVGCASSAPERVVSRIPVSEQSYVLDPLTGYPLTVEIEAKQRLRDAFGGFAAGESLTVIAAEAEALAAADPSFLPAVVLRAQVDFVNRIDRGAVDRLQPILDELPDYLAASLLAARAHERLGATIQAYEIFNSLAPINRKAYERAAELRPKALEIVERRFEDALARGRAEEAAAHLEQLEAWQVEERSLLALRRSLHFQTGDLEAELETLRRSVEVGLDSDRFEDAEAAAESRVGLLKRLGELELEVGDVRAGMDIFEALAAEFEEDPVLADQVERARFLWRLELLPPKIKAIARLPELDRADLASLLYWLFPNVRFSRVDDPPIAADILDHPNREEVLRVLDLELMDVDETLHRFDPNKGATRQVALAALLSLLQAADPPASCMRGELNASATDRDRRWVCQRAVDCSLIVEVTECLPAATLSGGEAVDLVRRCLDRMGPT